MSLKDLGYKDHIRIGTILMDLATSEGEAPSFSEFLTMLGDSFSVGDDGRIVADTTKAAGFVVRVRDVMVRRWGEAYVAELLGRIGRA